MYTYQDLLKVGDSELAKGQFCYDAVIKFQGTSSYIKGREATRYYEKHNTTIEQYQKWLYTMTGRKIPDMVSANYKIKTLFFRRLVSQQVQYTLGNGVTLQDPENKKKLGKDFDFKLQEAATKAMVQGRAYGFWNYDHMEVFGHSGSDSEPGFCALDDENTGKLMAGIRFWSRTVGDELTNWFTLYESDGITEYIKRSGEPVEVLNGRTPYKRTEKKSNAFGVEEVTGSNYGCLPIVQIRSNSEKESELAGIREAIDAYDLIKSGLANSIDDASEIYWVIRNAGGMDDADIAKFLQRLREMHGAALEGNEEVESREVNVPFEARKAMLEILRKDIYEDFQALDVNTLSAAAKTTQEIQAAYQTQDNKCAEFEYYITDFVNKILALAGIEDAPSFVWNRVVNQAEQVNMILSAANYLSEEMIIKKLPFLTPEEADIVIKQRAEEGYSMFNNGQGNPDKADEQEDD